MAQYLLAPQHAASANGVGAGAGTGNGSRGIPGIVMQQLIRALADSVIPLPAGGVGPAADGGVDGGAVLVQLLGHPVTLHINNITLDIGAVPAPATDSDTVNATDGDACDARVYGAATVARIVPAHTVIDIVRAATPRHRLSSPSINGGAAAATPGSVDAAGVVLPPAGRDGMRAVCAFTPYTGMWTSAFATLTAVTKRGNHNSSNININSSGAGAGINNGASVGQDGGSDSTGGVLVSGPVGAGKLTLVQAYARCSFFPYL
jgi:hypothetical protein